MTTSVQFNGATLIRPGAYSKTDTSAFNTTLVTGLGTVALVGEADYGGEGVKEFFSYEDVKAEYISGDLVDAASLLVNPSGDPRITGGASKIVCVKSNTNTGTAASLSLKDTGGTAVCVELTAKAKGQYGDLIKASVTTTASPAEKVVFLLERTLQGTTLQEAKTFDTPKFSIKWNTTTTAAATVALDIDGTKLEIDAAGITPKGEFIFSNYKTLPDLLEAIKGYNSAVEITKNVFPGSVDFPVSSVDSGSATTGVFDHLSGQSIKDTDVPVTAFAEDVVRFVNASSTLATAERSSTHALAPRTMTSTSFSGAADPSSTTSTWTSSINALQSVEVNQVVPLYSAVDSTFNSILSTLQTHVQTMSSTANKKERQGWVGYDGTTAEIVTAANSVNSKDVCMSSEKLKLPRGINSTLQFYPAWGGAVVRAGMRAAADIGEPLTFKNVKAFGLKYSWWTTASSTSLDGDIKTLLLNGVGPIIKDLSTNTYKIEKCITTYIASENNALMEESIVQGLKTVTTNLRRGLDVYTGTKATLGQIQNIRDTINVVLGSFGPEDIGGNGFLIRSIADDGSELPPWRDISITIGAYPDPSDVCRVAVTVTPVSGINFILNTIFAVPAQLSSSVI